MNQRALGASSALLCGAGVSSDSESVAAGVSIPLLRASRAVAQARGFAAAETPAAPCREVPAPWRALLTGMARVQPVCQAAPGPAG